MNKPKTLREIRDFLNDVDEQFLERTFIMQQENEAHFLHFLDKSNEDLYYDPENFDYGNMELNEWDEYYPEVDKTRLKVGIPKNCPIFTEDF